MKMTKVAAAFFVVGMACNPTLGWSQPADVFPSFGSDKEVVSEKSDDFRGGMECVDLVYELSGIPRSLKYKITEKKGKQKVTTTVNRTMGNAGKSWVDNATDRGYTVSDTPKNKSVGILPSHVYWVKTASKSADKNRKGEYDMYIEHANFETEGAISKYHEAIFYGTSNQVAIKQNKWGYIKNSLGFITKGWK